jgi:hypothetical protein
LVLVVQALQLMTVRALREAILLPVFSKFSAVEEEEALEVGVLLAQEVGVQVAQHFTLEALATAFCSHMLMVAMGVMVFLMAQLTLVPVVEEGEQALLVLQELAVLVVTVGPELAVR